MPKFATYTQFSTRAATSPQLSTFKILQQNTIMRDLSGSYGAIFKSGTYKMLSSVIRNDVLCDYVIFGKPHCYHIIRYLSKSADHFLHSNRPA